MGPVGSIPGRRSLPPSNSHAEELSLFLARAVARLFPGGPSGKISCKVEGR